MPLPGRTPPVPDARRCEKLAHDLRDAGFTAAAVRGAWGALADDAIGRGLRSPAERALAGRVDALAVLALLLALGVDQHRDAVDAALPRTGAAGLVDLGLAALEGDVVVPTALVRPQSYADAHGEREWWIASDLDESALRGPLPEDHVLGVGGASLTLAGLVVPTSASRALDLGSGCGIQSLRIRREVDEVVATDVSERALRFTRLNALLNAVDGVQTRRGSLFEPVEGEMFDRIVSNPPFVITPRLDGVPAYEYRDGGLEGDALIESVITGAGRHLRPGGIAQLLGNWETRGGMPGLERVAQWVAASDVPLDAWVVERESLDPLAYASLWVRDGGTVPGTDAYERLVTAWLDDFARRGVAEVGFGYVLLRRPVSGIPTLRRYETVTTAVAEGTLGAHLADALDAHDRLAHLDDEALAGIAFAVAADVTEARHHLPGSESPSVIELRQGGGFARVVSVDPALAGVVGACDGELPVGLLIDAVADLLDADAAALRANLLPRIRELATTGFLGFL